MPSLNGVGWELGALHFLLVKGEAEGRALFPVSYSRGAHGEEIGFSEETKHTMLSADEKEGSNQTKVLLPTIQEMGDPTLWLTPIKASNHQLREGGRNKIE